ncbi:hypothetical protein N7493_004234 [Penicillium malachiteum]|uniref:Uncharacterized protein n=1 Tax=Penicillium malachiteum TaxID=1324776 RepID=A0AAD6MYB2_9EURO|nr:hypothetical protein N7493_004234 [Penicillium malachiteum]
MKCFPTASRTASLTLVSRCLPVGNTVKATLRLSYVWEYRPQLHSTKYLSLQESIKRLLESTEADIAVNARLYRDFTNYLATMPYEAEGDAKQWLYILSKYTPQENYYIAPPSILALREGESAASIFVD